MVLAVGKDIVYVPLVHEAYLLSWLTSLESSPGKRLTDQWDLSVCLRTLFATYQI